MNKFYFLSSIALFFISCTTSIGYMGESAMPTNKVDFFVDPSSITKNYKVIGKGYVQHVGLGSMPEKIQEKAILKGMEIGADAVLVQEYWTTDSGTSINTSYGLDSTRKKVITSRDSGSNGFSITYLKYQ
jgi:hypothetical protein